MDYLIPIILSAIAGSATGLGGLIIITFGEIEDKIIGFLMGFAGGVMLIVSFVKLFNEALTVLSALQVTLAFSIGTLIMMVLILLFHI